MSRGFLKMPYKRVLTIQDISCFGQCSLTVALPILSAAGLETVILPSAVLSTHTAGFTGFTVRDLTGDIPGIAAHWKREGISFDALYTGYLGSAEQIGMVCDIADTLLKPGAVTVVDPAMADNGKLYPAFDLAFVDEMKKLVSRADIVLPNITEASYLTGIGYKETYGEDYIRSLTEALLAMGAKTVVLTGVSYDAETTGVAVHDVNGFAYYRHEKLPQSSHGTGDVYASAFVGAYVQGKSAYDAAAIAADYTVACIKYTDGDPQHRYGVKFEPVLPELIKMIGR